MKSYFFIISIFLITACNKTVTRHVHTTKVKQGEFLVDVVESGEIHATNAVNISSPAMSWRFGLLKITKIVEDGDELSKGDTAIVFDPSEVQKSIIDANAELEIAKAELEKMQAEHQSQIEELKANLKIARISLKIAEIELEQATYEADVTKKEIQLRLEKAKIDLEKAKSEIENQKKIHTEEIRQTQLNIEQLKTNLKEANTTLKNLTVTSPAPGIAILRKNWSTGKKWQVGDQPWSGNPMIDLPDLRELKVETEINEVDISKIEKGQSADIKLDAFSDTVYTGQVTSIATLARYKEEDSKVKVFPVEVVIDGSPKNFLPGMTVSCKIVVDKISDVLFIPIEAIFKNGTTEYVYLKSGNSFEKKKVETGLANNDYIIIEQGLTKDDVVALSDPFKEDKQDSEDKQLTYTN